ncbi:hypothetical protein B0H13DRAFT_1918903 [Mycena leptocephala]|nr:hypothetical protein B0H13DRAFT_1918903 [Mycena leptocephala]
MPVAGKTNLYEINGWMSDITSSKPSPVLFFSSYVSEVMLGRVWMKLRDRQSFQFVWEEFLSLVRRLTNQRLGFVALHRGGTLLGINADMEASPLLGMADALLPIIDIPSVAEQIKDSVGLVKRNVRIHYSHVKRHLSREDQNRIPNFMYIELPQTSEISRYGSEHYLILRAYSAGGSTWRCTNGFSPAVFNACPTWTPIFGGHDEFTRSPIRDSLDTRRAAEIEITLQSGNLCPGRNYTRCEY